MPSACSRVVELPELVTAILEQLHDNKALFAALQVNKLWAGEATILLWRGKSATWALARIEDAERRQYYAAKTSTMELYCEGNVCQGHSELQNLLFPRLSSLSLDEGARGHEEILLQALQPMLRTLTWFGPPTSKSSLAQYHARCPALRSLNLHDRIDTTTTDDLLQFLSGWPSLTSILLECYSEDSVSEEVYIHLASRPKLASLRTSPKTITLSVIKRVQEVVTQPFSQLVELSCALEGKAFSQLSLHLARLTKLNLHLVNVASDTVLGICSCTGLVSLELDFVHSSHLDARAHFPPETFLAIAKSCSHLQIFYVKDIQRDRITGINDDVIQSFVALLPGLLCFRLQIKTNVTHRALKILGEGCAHMRDCALEGKSFNLKRLESKGPVLFPQLKWLELQPPVVGHTAAELAKILHHHAPCVERFTIGGSRRFYQDIDYEIRELQRRDKGWSLV